MDQYFTQIHKITQNKKISARIRFMLQDVIDLRKVSEVLIIIFGFAELRHKCGNALTLSAIGHFPPVRGEEEVMT